jgi:hypothetical protein
MTWVKHTVPHNSIEAEALRCERDAVISEFKQWTAVLMEETGWNEGVAMLVGQHLILAYEIGAELRGPGRRKKGERPAGPPEALRRLCHEAYALTGDKRAAALVERAFLIGWERNRRKGRSGAPKKTAGATVMELMKRRSRTENDKRERYRMRKRLAMMIQELRSRSREG